MYRWCSNCLGRDMAGTVVPAMCMTSTPEARGAFGVPRRTSPRPLASVVVGEDSPAGPAGRLAANHLQGPPATVDLQLDHLLSLVRGSVAISCPLRAAFPVFPPPRS